MILVAYYNVCPLCNANLDPGEKCDCMDKKVREERKRQEFFRKSLKAESKTGQIAFNFQEDVYEKAVNF